MTDEWLTYGQVAERLHVSPEAARQKAIRGRWQRTIGNDKRARVRLPDGWTNGVHTTTERGNRQSVRTGNERANGQVAAERLILAVEAHVETLKGELVTERERTSQALVNLERERMRADKAVADYQRLAEEFGRQTEELVRERARPWWRRLVR